MQFNPPLRQARLIRRYKRFLADVELPDGQVLTIHCPNTGAMTGCAEPGNRIWFSESQNPQRKYPCTWELAETAAGHLICVNTNRANTVIAEAIEAQQIPALAGYGRLRREIRYGAGSRIDIHLSEGRQADAWVEVKSVTLLSDQEPGQGFFPDAVTQRGQKHLTELMLKARAGDRAVLVFAMLHSGIQQVRAADHIDPRYAELLRQARAAGVEVLDIPVQLSATGLEVRQEVC